MIDTHTHLYLEEFDADGHGADTVRRAIDAGVQHLVFPNVDISTIVPMKALASQFPSHTSMAMGLHPTEIKDHWQDDLSVIFDELGEGKEYVAVGEVGIDLYWDKTFESEQMQAFEAQVKRSKELGLPVIIHCRDGLDQTLEILRGVPGVQAVFHSFGGTIADVEKIRNVGDYYFGINGIVTFKNCGVRHALPEITTERLLLETDAPYLAPVPHRGKRNESAYIIHTAAHIANHLGLPIEEIDKRTTENAYTLFGKLPR